MKVSSKDIIDSLMYHFGFRTMDDGGLNCQERTFLSKENNAVIINRKYGFSCSGRAEENEVIDNFDKVELYKAIKILEKELLKEDTLKD